MYGRRLWRFACAVLVLAACDDATDPDGGTTTDGGSDSGQVDSGRDLDAAVDAGSVDAGGSDGGRTGCGTERPPVDTIRGTEGLVIGRDGTIYYSQPGAVGRMAPGGVAENSWAPLPGASATVWGLALNAANDMLYVGSPSLSRIYAIDVTMVPPVVTELATATGDGPNGLTIGPDGALYYSDFSNDRVMRDDLSGAAATQVNTADIRQANGVAFADDGTLYVASYGMGRLFRLTLDASGVETGRDTIASGLGSPDGVAFDADGRIYVTNNGGGTLIRLEADGTLPMELATGLSAPASIEFGAGPLRCTDIYVAKGGALLRFEGGTAAGRAVPWH
jgi:DNA-binding beta-propeller fold protein YncE